jgi:hypothetical protein
MKLTAESITNTFLFSDCIQVFDNDLYKNLTLVESLVEEKIIKPTESTIHGEYVVMRSCFINLMNELIKYRLFEDAVELVDSFICHVRRHGKALAGLISHTQNMRSSNKQQPLNINRLILFAQATLEAVTFVNEDGKQIQLELEQRREDNETNLFSCLNKFVNITSAIRALLS